MKKVLVWLLVAVMAFAAIGCSTPAAQGPEGDEGGDGTKTAADMKVVALLPGTITDNGWNYICYEALKGIADEHMGGKEPE